LHGADYVVCMMNHGAPLTCEGREAEEKSMTYNAQKKNKKKKSAQARDNKPLTSFLQLLYPLMRQEESIQVFLYQVGIIDIDWKISRVWLVSSFR